MATAAIETRQAEVSKPHHQQSGGVGAGEGLRQYYQQRIQDMQLLVRLKNHDLQRLEAQRNDLNARGFLQIRLKMCIYILIQYTQTPEIGSTSLYLFRVWCLIDEILIQ